MEEHHDGCDTGPEVVLDGPVSSQAITEWCLQVQLRLGRGGGSAVNCHVGGLLGSAGEVLEAVARVQLTALRFGGTAKLNDVPPELATLLELFGLRDVLASGSDERSDGRGIEEGVELHDLVALPLDDVERGGDQ